MSLLVVGCSLDSATTEDEATSSTEQHATVVTTIKVNGRSAFALLSDSDGTNGFFTATQDQIANTSGLDFSWATPDPTNADFMILYQGAGPIPNSAYTRTATTARIVFTTGNSYPVTRCVVNVNTGDFTCAPLAGSLSFNLTFTQNGFGKTKETTKRKEVLGPVTTKIDAEFKSVTASITGTYGGHNAAGLSGDLTDTESKTNIREITVN
ncbi:MAG: hypothetical protein ABI867_11450 [Kofleriaceae bacterium]